MTRDEIMMATEALIDLCIEAIPDERIAAHKLVMHDARLGMRALGVEEVRGILRHLLLPGSTLRGGKCGRAECAVGCAGDCYE